MKKCIWLQDSIDPTACHGVTLNEVEEACLKRRAFVQYAKSYGENPVYAVRGHTTARRSGYCVGLQGPDRTGYAVFSLERK